MSLTPPAWAKDAVPTVRGWVSPKGELLKSQKISPQDVATWQNMNNFTVESTPEPEPAPEVLTEAPPSQKGLEDYSKNELIALGEQHGIQLSSFKSKKALAKELEEHLLSE